jgi:NAD(P)-dependent dehydrogenase (short-subunit alcohol dehydrogenase family)
MAGKMGVPGWSAYCTAKHAVIGFTKCIAREYATQGIRCNAVCPGFVDTDMMSAGHLEQWAEALGMTRRELVKEIIYKMAPQAKYVDARSVATAAAFLLSDQAADVTGQSLNVSAGIGDY